MPVGWRARGGWQRMRDAGVAEPLHRAEKSTPSGDAWDSRFADDVVVLLRQHIVAVMRPIAFATAQLNVALRDGSVSPIPAAPRGESDPVAAGGVAGAAQGAERSVGAPVDDGDDALGGEVAA